MTIINLTEDTTTCISTNIISETSSNLDTCTVEVPYNYTISIGDELNIYDKDSTLIFKGLVQTIKIAGRKEIVAYDYGVQLMDININDIYTSQKAEDIIEDIVNKTDLTYVSTITTSLAITTFLVKDKIGWDVINELAELLNASFRVDKNKNFYLELIEEDMSTENITTENAVIDDDWNQDADQLINKVTIIGDKQLFEKTQTFDGTGVETTFTLAEFPVDTNVSVGGVEQTGYVEGATTTADYSVTTGTKDVIFASGSIPAVGTANIVIRYTFAIDIKLVSQDSASIASYGGPNLIAKEKKIVKPYITSFQEARSFANFYLGIYAQPLLTSTWIINDYTKFENFVPNQKIEVVDSIRGINDTFIIKKVEREFPGQLKVEIGWPEDNILDWNKEVQYRIKQLEEIDNNSTILQEYGFIENKVQLQVTSTVERQLYRDLPDNYLYFADEISGLVGWWKGDGNTLDSSGEGNTGTFTGFEGEVGHWDLNGDALDKSGNGNNGTWTGTEAYDTGLISGTQAGDFDGSSRITTVTMGTLGFSSVNDNIAFAFWAKRNFDGNNWILDTGFSSGSGAGFDLVFGGDSINFRLASANAYSYNTDDLEWHHYIITDDGTTTVMYQNNVIMTPLDDPTHIQSTYTSAQALYIGNGASTGFDGQLQDFRIFDRIPTNSERARIYNEALGTIAALTPYDEGKQFDEAMDFNGSSYVTTTLNSDLGKDKDYSVSVWINSSLSLSEQVIWQNSNAGDDRNSISLRSDGRIAFAYYNGSDWVSASSNTGTIIADTWYNVIGINNNGTPLLYINTIDFDDNVYNGYATGSGSYIGSAGALRYFTGQIGDVRTFSSVLTSDERTSIYNSGLGLTSNANINEIGLGEDRVLSCAIGGDDGLKGWWKLDGNANDYSGNDNTGTWVGTELYDTGKQFDEAGDFNELSEIDTGLAFPQTAGNSICVSAWFNTNDTTDTSQAIVANVQSGFNNGFSIYVAGTKVAIKVDDTANHDNTSSSADGTITQDTWHHIIMEIDGVNLTVKGYLDNSLEISAILDPAWTGMTTNTNAKIGKYTPNAGYYFDGQIGDVRFYSGILSENERTALYNSGLGSVDNAYNELSDGTSGTKYLITDKNYWATPDYEIDATGSLQSWSITGFTENCEMYLTLDTDNTTQPDASGNDNVGTVVNATYNATGKIGGCYDFDGTGDYITTDSLGVFGSGKSASLGFWFNKTNDGSSDFLFSVRGDTYIRATATSTGTIQVQSSAGNVTSTNTFSFGVFNHLLLVVVDTNLKLYINGVLFIDTTISYDDTLGSNYWFGAAYGGTASTLNGKMDEIVVFSRALTLEQVVQLYNSDYGLQYPF